MSFARAVVPLGVIPAEPNEFVGRAAELRELDGLLRATRLVTLTGPGGVGKTRMALRAAAAAAPRYTDGVWLVELSALRDPRLLPHVIAQRIGAAQRSAGTYSDALLEHLRGRRLLLVLDACEHLAGACAELAGAILAGAPSVTVLATSRESLGVPGETTVGVRPLPVPGLARLGEEPHPFGVIDLEARRGRSGGGQRAAGGDAVKLFARRAAAAVPGFAVTEANRAEVTGLCRRLGGVPLTIELAASRIGQYSIAELSRHLASWLALLTGGGDPDERRATARDAIAWSYDTCTATERTLWARLSVFPGSFDAAAAVEVCASGELSGAEISATIATLTERSLLMPAGADERGRPRYRMLDTIREFGAQQLAASGEDCGIRDRFVARYLAIARHVEDHASGDEQVTLFGELRREQASIRAALEYSLDGPGMRPDSERDGAELTTRLWAYWLSAGMSVEAGYWLGRALERVPDPGPQRAWILVARCLLGAVRGTIPQAVADGRAAVRLAESLQRPQIAGRAHMSLCLALTFAGRLEAAGRSGRAAERLLTQLDDVTGLTVLDAHLALLHQARGEPDKAIACYQRGIARLREYSGERVYRGYLSALGAGDYAALFGAVGRHTLDQVVALAIAGALDGSAPGLAQAGGPAGTDGLTDREREIAFLAAAGPSGRR